MKPCRLIESTRNYTNVYRLLSMFCVPHKKVQWILTCTGTHNEWGRHSLGSSRFKLISSSFSLSYSEDGADVVCVKGLWWWTGGRLTGSSTGDSDWTTFRCVGDEESIASAWAAASAWAWARDWACCWACAWMVTVSNSKSLFPSSLPSPLLPSSCLWLALLPPSLPPSIPPYASLHLNILFISTKRAHRNFVVLFECLEHSYPRLHLILRGGREEEDTPLGVYLEHVRMNSSI